MPIGVLDKDGAPQTIATIDDLIALFGQGASPAANTLQARIDQLKGFTDGVEALITSTNAALATLNGQTDTLESLIGTTNGALATVVGQTDTLEALIASTNTKSDALAALITTQAGYVDGLEAAIASTNTKMDTLAGLVDQLEGYTDGVEGKLDTLHNDITAGTVASTAPGTAATQMVGMQGATAMVPIATVGKTAVFDVTLVLDTAAYAAGDVLFVTQLLNGILRIPDGTGIVQSIQVIDQDDNGVAFDLYFLSANVAMGTINVAPSITDANAVNILGVVSVATTDYKDIGGAKVASIRNIGLPVKALTGTDDLCIAGVNGAGTPTFTASGIKLRIGVLLD